MAPKSKSKSKPKSMKKSPGTKRKVDANKATKTAPKKVTTAAESAAGAFRAMMSPDGGVLKPLEPVGESALIGSSAPAVLVGPDQATLAAVTELGAKVQLAVITDESSAKTAYEMLTQLKALRERIDAERLKLTKPIKAIAKRIESMFSPISLKLDDYDQHLRERVLAYRQKVDTEQRAAQQQLLAAATKAQEAGDHATALALAEQSTEVAALQTTTVVDTGTVQMKKTWDFEVVDLGCVPEAYKTLDDAKVRAAIRAGMRDELAADGSVTRAAIPGIRIFQKESLAVGSA